MAFQTPFSRDSNVSKTISREQYCARVFFARPSLGEKGSYHVHVFQTYEAAKTWLITYEKLKKYCVAEVSYIRFFVDGDHEIGRQSFECVKHHSVFQFQRTSCMIGQAANPHSFILSEWVLDPIFRDLDTD